MKHNALLFIFSVVVTVLTAVAVDANQQFKFTMTPGSGPPGSSVDLQVLFDNDKDQVQGWSIGVCHDASVLTINSVSNGAVTQAFNDGEGPDLYFPNIYPTGPLGPGWNAGAVIS